MIESVKVKQIITALRMIYFNGASSAFPFCLFMVQLFNMFLFLFFLVNHVREPLAEENQNRQEIMQERNKTVP